MSRPSPLNAIGSPHRPRWARVVLDAAVLGSMFTSVFFPWFSIYSSTLLLVLALSIGTRFEWDTQKTAVLLLAAWILVVSILTQGDDTSLYAVTRVIGPSVITFVALRTYLTTARNMSVALICVLGVSAIMGLYFIREASLPERTPTEMARADFQGVTFRPVIETYNSNWVAYSLACGVIAGAFLMWHWRSEGTLRGARLMLLAPLAFVFSVMVYTGARGALLTVICFVLAFALFRRWTVAMTWLLSATLVVWALLFTFSATTITAWIVARSSGESQALPWLDGREVLWPSAEYLIQQNPLVGYGVGAQVYLLPLGVPPHNLPLSLSFSIGVIGLLLYIAVAISILFTKLMVAKSPPYRQWGAIPGVIVCALLPIWTTGVWEWTGLNWTMLAIAGAAATLRASGVSEVVPQMVSAQSNSRRRRTGLHAGD